MKDATPKVGEHNISKTIPRPGSQAGAADVFLPLDGEKRICMKRLDGILQMLGYLC